jgi:nucleoside-diphosphate-sugar epimerase
MRALVTGAAGFVGSTLVDRLLASGHEVVGVDSFTDYYDPRRKHRNLEGALASDRFTLVRVDLAQSVPDEIVDGIETVFHLAAQPGVRASWGTGFASYLDRNLLATQGLLEAFRGRRITRFVNSSSSSVYGNAEHFPTSEDETPHPVSPYGVTKLAAEHLCNLYGTNYGVPTVSLRLFTVFGPRQRPDMAMHRLIDAATTGAPFPLYGDGNQIRDFTYVDDVVEANILSTSAELPPATVLNIGGGSMTSLSSVIATVERLVGSPVPIEHSGDAAGDARATGADTSRAEHLLGWKPQISVERGLAKQVAWQCR